MDSTCNLGYVPYLESQVAQNYGLLSVKNGLLWGIVAYNFRLLGVPGNYLESQVALNNRQLYPKVAHDSLKIAHYYRLLAFQVKAIGSSD